MTPYELNDMIKKLRNGEKVTCPLCGKGILQAIGNCETTKGFKCTECKKGLNIN